MWNQKMLLVPPDRVLAQLKIFCYSFPTGWKVGRKIGSCPSWSKKPFFDHFSTIHYDFVWTFSTLRYWWDWFQNSLVRDYVFLKKQFFRETEITILYKLQIFRQIKHQFQVPLDSWTTSTSIHDAPWTSGKI